MRDMRAAVSIESDAAAFVRLRRLSFIPFMVRAVRVRGKEKSNYV